MLIADPGGKKKEIIHYPPVHTIQHLNCRRVKEREIRFDAHMSGYVYKVRVNGTVLIKKEIPSPDTIDEFLYEINALSSLYPAENVIQFYGVVVDDSGDHVTGLLIDYAARGALIDVILDADHSLPWSLREKWARQIVGGLAEIHEAGFVQGDFTLSNIVIDGNDDAKIIDINRRGCPIGWEPPETTALIEGNLRIAMYIGVKSDLYQLGMVLWALATQEDYPESFSRPLRLDPDMQVPVWYRRIVDTCLSADPRCRAHAFQLLSWFPDSEDQQGLPDGSSVSDDQDEDSHSDYVAEGFTSTVPQMRTVHPGTEWTYVGWDGHQSPDEPGYIPSRGRSPPSPIPSRRGDYDDSRYGHREHTWSDTYNLGPTAPSVGEMLSDEAPGWPKDPLEERNESPVKHSDRPGRSGATTTGTRGQNEYSTAGHALSTPAENIQDRRPLRRTEETGRLGRDSVPPPDQPSMRERARRSSREARVPNPPGRTAPGSLADSGKDVTYLVAHPGDGEADIVVPENATRLLTELSPRDGRCPNDVVVTATTPSEASLSQDAGYTYEPPDLTAGPYPRGTRFGQLDDLKGIGSALGAGCDDYDEGYEEDDDDDDDDDDDEDDDDDGDDDDDYDVPRRPRLQRRRPRRPDEFDLEEDLMALELGRSMRLRDVVAGRG